MSDIQEKFKEALLKGLERAAYSDRLCKDSGRECVVLFGNKRICLGKKNVWSSYNYANRAIQRYIVDGKSWWISDSNTWRRMYNFLPGPSIPAEFKRLGKSIRKEWAERNLRIVPLRDYMHAEFMRAQHKK